MGKRRISKSHFKETFPPCLENKKSRKCNYDESCKTKFETQSWEGTCSHQNNENFKVEKSSRKKCKISANNEKVVLPSILPNYDSSTESALSVPYNNKEIPVLINYFNKSDLSNRYWIILTHGAGGDLNTPQLKAVSQVLVADGFVVARFTCKGLNIKYRINVFCEIFKFLNEMYIPKGVFIGGRSMGARAAVMLASDKVCDAFLYDKLLGILCLSYPLHKINDLNELRDGPLLKLQKPVFFLSGTKDEMCKKTVLEKILKSIEAPYKIHWLVNYDHSARSHDNYQENTYKHAFNEILKWCHSISK